LSPSITVSWRQDTRPIIQQLFILLSLSCGASELVTAHHGRCTACHGDNGSAREDDSPAPLRFGYGSDDATTHAMMSIYSLIGTQVVDMKNPAASTLLTKPIAEGSIAQSSLAWVTGLWHGGGPRLHTDGDREDALFDFGSWIEQYEDCAGESPQ
jgi:hypothetical protein